MHLYFPTLFHSAKSESSWSIKDEVQVIQSLFLCKIHIIPATRNRVGIATTASLSIDDGNKPDQRGD